jgi:uncharacterized membrane protein
LSHEPGAGLHAGAPLGQQPAGGLPGGWVLQLGPFALLAAAAGYLHSRWESIPLSFPTHWGADGRANGWAPRSVASVYGPLVIATALIAVMALLAQLQRRATRPIHPGAPVHYTELRYRRGVLTVLLAGEYMLALTFSWAAMLPLLTGGGTRMPPQSFLLIIIMPALFVIWTVVYLARLRPRHAPQGGDERSAERHWRAGVFYVNPEDPSLMVPKRYGLGYTLNFARPAAWLVMALLLAVPLGVAAWVLLHAAR